MFELESLESIFSHRDGMSPERARAEMDKMKERILFDDEDPEDVLREYGLELDYILQLI